MTFTRIVRGPRAGAGAGVTSAVKDVTGREPIGFERFAQDHAAALR
ncbi:hypothetical protein WMF11_12530 [Sorangium sp. So ce295]|jgi:hypothetical protein